MDVKEFKAWFEGFCESIGDAPTPEQFEKIKAKVQGLQVVPKVAYRGEFPNRWADLEPKEPRLEPLIAR